MRGTLPASSVFNTRSALLMQVTVISLRYLELAAPSFFRSGMATAMLPASSTMWPMASRRASSPATRTAEGPMSTPRRDWPKSSGTPITRISLGTMLEEAAMGGVIVLSLGPRGTADSSPPLQRRVNRQTHAHAAGTLKWTFDVRGSISAVPSGRNSYLGLPGVETPGYYPAVPTGRASTPSALNPTYGYSRFNILGNG